MGAYEPKFMYGDETTGTAVSDHRRRPDPGRGRQRHPRPGRCDRRERRRCRRHRRRVRRPVLVLPRGKIHISTASGAITAGARVDSGAAGTVASGTSALTNIGVALTTAIDTGPVEWMEFFRPHLPASKTFSGPTRCVLGLFVCPAAGRSER